MVKAASIGKGFRCWLNSHDYEPKTKLAAMTISFTLNI